MANLNFTALAIASVLLALCEGRPVTFVQPQCQPNGYLDKTTIDNGILQPINDERAKVAKHEQQNGMSPTQKLPPATGMTQLKWSCTLEQTAIKALGETCDYDPPANTGGMADFFFSIYDDTQADSAEKIMSNAIVTNILPQITINPLSIASKGTVISNAIYNGPEQLKTYANVIRPNNTEIGCALNRCENDKRDSLYCIFNSPDITVGEIVYAGTTVNTGKCSEITCPAGYMCNSTTLLCETTTATSSPTASTSATMSTAASSSSSASTSAAISTSSTTSAGAATTTIPTSPQAEFPTGSGGGGMCSYANANRMTDTLRKEYVRLHNFRRGLLATGQIPRKDGKHLPTASNMRQIKYDCTLEEGAVNWASQCPTTLSEPSTRPNVGENFKTFPATRFNFDTAAKKSVTEWWKVIRDVNYFERVVVFRPFHDGAPISSFTQMGWATSNLLGCAIVRCRNDGRYVGVCRYSPRGNIVNSNVYQVGTPCSACPTGASSCSTADGLCF